MNDATDTLTLPHDLYARIAAYASSRGETPETVVAEWLRERLRATADETPATSAELEARLRAIESLEGILSAPVERDWADQHDLDVASESAEDTSGNGQSA